MGNENSTTSKARGQPAKAPSIKPQSAPRKLGRPSTKAEKVDLGVYPEQHGKKPLYNDDTFNNFIQRAKYKIRSMSTSGRLREEISNPAPDVANVPTTNQSTKDDHKDHFSDFIQHTKKKLRTTSSFGKHGSFKRG